MIYWTRSGSPTPEIDFADNPAEHEQDIFKLLGEPSPETAEQSPEALELLLQSPGSGKSKTLESVDADSFYSCMLSGAAARIAVRSWIETTTVAMKEHIADWFRDIAVMEYDANAHQPKLRLFALRTLAESCGVHRKKESGGKTAYELDRSDDFLGRAATQLWNCALLGKEPPLLLLDRVLRRIRMEQGKVTAARVALLKLILNRNRYTITGGRSMQARQDPDNATTAYMAGRIFAVLESIQTAALGKEINAPIRDRFFSFASTNPAPAFGRLLKMSQNHLGKLRGDKPGLAVILDKQLGELFTRIKTFPTIFSLEEQGQFAIGYYHQRQESFAKNANNEEQGERHV